MIVFGKKRKSVPALMILVISLLMFSRVFVAAPEETTPSTGQTTTDTGTTTTTDPKDDPAATEKPGKWKKSRNYFYYYDSEGKKSTGLTVIGNKTYYFDKSGKQKTGWQKIGKSYYFFRMKNKAGGYMIKNKTVNSVKLKKNGKAKTSGMKAKLALMWKCSQIVSSCTKPTWSVSKKMNAAWNWMQSNLGYSNLTWHHYSDWDVHFGTLAFSNGWASCEGLGCAWAYLANACGAKNCYSVCSGGHGWSEINGLVYDPSWDRVDKRNNYYGMSLGLSGVNGRPAYAGNGCYRKKV